MIIILIINNIKDFKSKNNEKYHDISKLRSYILLFSVILILLFI